MKPRPQGNRIDKKSGGVKKPSCKWRGYGPLREEKVCKSKRPPK